MAKTNTIAIIVFDAVIFNELLHKSVLQHTVPPEMPKNDPLNWVHETAQDPENDLNPLSELNVFLNNQN
jgi:hypothetical protein